MSAMPNADYMRMLTDFQAEGGVVGQNATKKLQEAQAIINANAGGGSPGFYNNQVAQTTQYPLGTGQNPFSFSQGTTTYSNYDPITNTIGKSMGGIAGNINGGRLNVADLINPDNVFQGDGVKNLNNAYYNKNFANAFNQYQNQANVNTGGNTGFDTTLPTQNPATSPVTGGLALGGMLPPVSMPVSAPIDYSQGGGGYIGIQGGFDDFGNINGSSAANAAREQYYSNTGFDTTLPTQAPVATPTTVGLTGIPSAPSSIGAGEVALGGLLGGLLGGGINLQNILGTAGQAYLGQEAISAPYEVGRAGLEMAEQVGTRALENTAFKPYTVTSNLAKVGTDPAGGFTTQLSPEQQALQNQIMGQAGGFFNQLQADPALAQAQLYEQMRAVQRPEEERNRLALEERMLSQGRLGLGSAAYGGSSPELLAQETARQEAMARANLGARQQALAEQQQTASLAGGLLSSGYTPQSQALALLAASQVPAGYADLGRREGAGRQATAGLSGIESLLQGTQLSQEAQLQLNKDLLSTITGRQDPLTGSFGGGLLSSALQKLPSWLGGGETSSTSDYSFLADALDFGSANPSQIRDGLMMGFTPDQIASAMNDPTSFEDNIDFAGSEYDY